jgi:hypothetical protein
MENYARTARSWLPNYQVSGLTNNPVFQIIDNSNNEILYTLRVQEDTFQAGVFSYGSEYTVKIGDPDKDQWQVIENVRSRYIKDESVIPVEF